MIARAALALMLGASAAMAAGPAPSPVARPNIFAPLVSPLPLLPNARRPDYQALLGAAVDDPNAQIMLYDRESGQTFELYLLAIVGADFSDEDRARYSLSLFADGTTTRLPFSEFEAFSEANPELGSTASIEPAAGPALRVRNAWLTRDMIELGQTPPAAYYVVLIAGSALEGDARLLSAGKALCRQIAYDESANIPAEDLAIVAAPVTSKWDWADDGASGTLRVALSEDYDFDLAAHWLETLQIAQPDNGLELGRNAFGFLATTGDPTELLTYGNAEEARAADLRYLDLSAVSAGYVEELVERVVKGMREKDRVRPVNST
jgi:hypothetical protein